MMVKNITEPNYFIRILEYGESVGNKGTSREAFLSWAANSGLGNMASSKHFDECYEGVGDSCVLKIEYYFRLIEYRELQEARKNAKEARYLSLIAILISIVAVFFSVFGTISLSNNTIESIGKSVSIHIGNKI